MTSAPNHAWSGRWPELVAEPAEALLGRLLAFLPDASDAMLAALGLEGAEWPDDLLVALNTVPSGQPFTVPPVPFAKLDDARRSELEARFAGTAG